MNLIEAFLDSAARHGDKPAIVAGSGETVSFSELARRSGALASAWRNAGLRRGDRVLVAMPVGIDLYAAIAGLWRLGATIVFPEPVFGLAGLRHAVRVTRPRALLTAGAYGLVRLAVPALWFVDLHLSLEADGAGDPVESFGADYPALMSFTSGSTGKPKTIVRSHGFLAAQDAALDPLIAPEQPDEVDLVAFPVFVLANLARGTTSVLPSFRLRDIAGLSASGILHHAAAHRVTRALVPPSIAEILADAPEVPLRRVLTGGGPVFPDLVERLVGKMPVDGDVVAVYGSTEAEPIAWQRASAITDAQWQAMTSGAGLLAGRPIDQIALQLIDDEIVVTGAHINTSYLDGLGDADNKLTRDGAIWHRTGDAGHIDEDGTLWLRGRHSGRVGGLYPFEIEAPARFWPGVRRAALLAAGDRPVLVIEGDDSHRATWQQAAAQRGVDTVLPIAAMPMDRRHHSKIDTTTLRKRLRLG